MTDATRTRAGTLAAFLGVAAILAGSVVAAAAYTGTEGEPYSPLSHWVSELGEPGVSDLAIAFNLGLVVGGAAFAVFMALLAASSAGRVRLAWGVAGMVTGIAGLLVGVFPMTVRPGHPLSAFTFFSIGWIAVGLATVDLLRRRDPRFPRALGAAGALAVAAFIGFLGSLAADSRVAAGLLVAPPDRPAFWLPPTLEWAVIAGILAWTTLVAWWWRRAR